MEIEPVGFKIVGRLTNVGSKKLYRWYRDVLSGYIEAHEDGKIMEHDLFDREDGRKRVPILKPEHIGSSMAIDEKYIAGEFYTVLTNADTGKIALLAQTVKSKELVDLITRFGRHLLNQVKYVSRDLSSTYDWVCRQSFWNATQVADKFHVVKHVLNQLQQIRIGYKQLLVHEYKQSEKAHYTAEYKKQTQFKKHSLTYKIQKYKHQDQLLPNGETHQQLLQRSRYLLFKLPEQHAENQKKRAKILFKHFPELKTAYQVIVKLRRWYSRKNIGKRRKTLIRLINNWYDIARKCQIPEIKLIKTFIKRHEGVILNYFISGKTNAIAEATNSKIQRFISSNYGIRDLDFFFFRAKIYFS